MAQGGTPWHHAVDGAVLRQAGGPPQAGARCPVGRLGHDELSPAGTCAWSAPLGTSENLEVCTRGGLSQCDEGQTVRTFCLYRGSDRRGGRTRFCGYGSGAGQGLGRGVGCRLVGQAHQCPQPGMGIMVFPGGNDPGCGIRIR